MPIYEYQCKACGALHEALQKVSDAPLTDCPNCGAPELRKKVTAAAFRLKGGGWYETDFKSGNKKNLAGDNDKSGSKGDGDSGSKEGGTKTGDASGQGTKTSTASESSGNSKQNSSANTSSSS